MGYARTALLLAALTGLFLGAGYLIGGTQGAVIALVLAAGMNLVSYWYSDKMVLGMYGAQEVQGTALNTIVAELASRAGLPMAQGEGASGQCVLWERFEGGTALAVRKPSELKVPSNLFCELRVPRCPNRPRHRVVQPRCASRRGIRSAR